MRSEWKVHTPNLLKEVARYSEKAVLRIPMAILGRLLYLVGERAGALNDPQLNDLMCRLTIYAIANPESRHYDPKRVRKIARAAVKARRST